MPKILAPDVIPNNFKIIREGRGIQIKAASEGLKIDRNFLSAVESNNKNFSGKKTVEALMFYGINFYKAYDIKEKITAPVTDEFPYTVRKSFSLAKSKYKKGITDNVITTLLSKELELDKQDTILLKEFKILNEVHDESNIIVELDVTLVEKKTMELEFDINFVENENNELTTMLKYRGYPETITEVDREIDGTNIILGDYDVYLGKEYKIPKKSKDIHSFELLDRLSLDDERLQIKTNEKGVPISIRFNAIKPEINNLKAIRTLANIDINEISEALGLSYNGYINLELGNQKISTKIMWRLVKLLRVPFELIINVEEYYDKYCLYNKKIIKKDGESDEE